MNHPGSAPCYLCKSNKLCKIFCAKGVLKGAFIHFAILWQYTTPKRLCQAIFRLFAQIFSSFETPGFVYVFKLLSLPLPAFWGVFEPLSTSFAGNLPIALPGAQKAPGGGLPRPAFIRPLPAIDLYPIGLCGLHGKFTAPADPGSPPPPAGPPANGTGSPAPAGPGCPPG